MYSCVVFDVDGTIINSEAMILNTLREALTERGYEADGDFTEVLGIPGKDGLARLGIDEKDIEPIYQDWYDRILTTRQAPDLFDGVVEVIKKLSDRNIPLGIVTSMSRQNFDQVFTYLKLKDYFSSTYCAEDTRKNKPYPDPLIACLDDLNIGASDAIYIGDSVHDYKCAKGAAAAFGLAKWGAPTFDGFSEAEFKLDHPKEILEIVK